MRKFSHISSYIIVLVFLAVAFNVQARDFNDKLMNRPYADLRRWHLGFSVGVHTQDLNFTNNGFITDKGESWFVEQPAFSPGFCVNGLIDFRLNEYFNVRFSPGMYFSNRDIRMYEATTGAEERQNIKSAHIVFPIDFTTKVFLMTNLKNLSILFFIHIFNLHKSFSLSFHHQ